MDTTGIAKQKLMKQVELLRNAVREEVHYISSAGEEGSAAQKAVANKAWEEFQRYSLLNMKIGKAETKEKETDEDRSSEHEDGQDEARRHSDVQLQS